MKSSVKYVVAALVVATLVISSSVALADTQKYTGTAYGPGGAVLYREQHVVIENNGRPERSTTTYFDAKGNTIGRLESNYARSAYAPDYTFKDLRSGKTEAARKDGSAVVLRFGDKEKRQSVSADDTVVLGQGMHHFVRLNLDRLSKQSMSVVFGIPSRLDTYTFRIRPTGTPSNGVVRLRIESDSWVVRAFAPYLEVDYEIATKRLLRYSGVSNIEGPGGETQNVVIVYNYDAS